MEEYIKPLNRNQLKYIVIIAMVIDHLAWTFVAPFSVLGLTMHFVGRLTGPVMAYFLAEGYTYTRDKRKYAVRLFLFSIISWIPYCLFDDGRWPAVNFSVMTTLFLGYLCIWMWDRSNIPEFTKVFIIFIICILAIYCDWGFIGVLWVFYFYTRRDKPGNMWMSFGIIAFVHVFMSVIESGVAGLFQAGIFLVPPLIIFFYNGELGSRRPFHKWFFYIFYPLHLLILAIIKMIVYK